MRYVAACLLLIGCSAPAGVEAVGSSAVGYSCLSVALPELGPESHWLTARLRVAVDAWQLAGACVTLSSDGIPVVWNDGPEAWIGAYNGERVALQRWALDRGARKAEGVLMHELGHALGLGHAESGIMTEVWSQSCIDLQAAVAAGGFRSTCD